MKKNANYCQRRAFFRTHYPKMARLKALNIDVEIIDICQIGLRFCSDSHWNILSKIIENNDVFEISVLFHDNTTHNIKGRITKCYSDIKFKQQHYVLMFTENIPYQKISDEQSYLLKHFPDFTKYLFTKGNQN